MTKGTEHCFRARRGGCFIECYELIDYESSSLAIAVHNMWSGISKQYDSITNKSMPF